MASIKMKGPCLISNDDLNINSIKVNVRKIYPKAFSKISELESRKKRIKIEINFDEATTFLKT